MSRSAQQRVEDALSQLVERLVPTVDGEDETAADDRFYQAFDFAKETIGQADPPDVVPDQNHVADLIRRKLVHDNDTPDKALQFSNLFSRLLSRPVLNQKWAILYLLYQLSDGPPAPPPSAGPAVPARRSSQPPQPTHTKAASTSPRKTNGHLEEAFARNGVPSLPRPDVKPAGPGSPRLGHRQNAKSLDEGLPRRPRNAPNGDVQHEEPVDTPAPGISRAPTEANLLRDIPFTLQGVSSTNLIFDPQGSLKIPSGLSPPLVSLLHALAEPALLYKGLSAFLEASDGGLIGQSLRAAIGVELKSYLGLVATLEGQIRQALTQFKQSDGKVGLGTAGVTLKRCVVWTRDATLGLRLMSLIVEDSRSKKGGQIITLIHSLSTSHGDPFVGAFAERLLSHVTQPFYDMLRSWIYDGELSDPFLEFFVSENNDRDDSEGRGAATSVWEDKYRLDDSMIPTIISEEFARKIFLTGKSLNFIRYGCGDSAWVEDYSKTASRELRYGDTAHLYSSIDEAYKTTMARLIWLMNDKFKLVEHLTAMKKYLLLGQGDFVALLLESLASNLDRPANSQYRHTLTAQLEHSIRNSNAQYDSADVLRRLDARMLELSMGEIGWDVFTLEYKVDPPVDVIVTSHSNVQYLKVFNFLWRVKRVEYALGVTWRRCMTGARSVLRAVEPGKSTGSGNDSAMDLSQDWKTARCVVAEMIHFVNQLQYYILFEVIESSWEALMRDLAKPGATLDDLILAHGRYLRNVTRKGLLGSSSSSSSGTSHGGSHGSASSPNFTAQLHELLKIMLAYRDAVDGLYALSASESARLEARDARIEARTRRGRWGVTERDDDDADSASSAKGGLHAARASEDMAPPLLETGADGSLRLLGGASGGKNDDGSALAPLRARMATLAAEFRARITGLLGDLAYQPDMDMRFLAVAMNFNEVYKVTRRSRRAEGHKRGDAPGAATGAAAAPAPAAAAAGNAKGGSGKDGKESLQARKGKEKEKTRENGGAKG